MAIDRTPLTADEIAGIVERQISDARAYYDSDRDGYREKALRYFEGECPDVPSPPHRSKVVSRDVADVHGMVMPSLLRVFFASPRVAIYEATREGTEKFADQATDYVNYVVMRECDGYRVFRDALSDALLLGNGILKHWWDPTPEYSVEDFSGLSRDQYQFLLGDPEYAETVAYGERPDPNWTPPPPPPMLGPSGIGLDALMRGAAGGPAPVPLGAGLPPAGMNGAPASPPGMQSPMAPGMQAPGMQAPPMPPPQPPVLIDCTIKRRVSSGRLRFDSVPYEEFLLDPAARILDEDNCRFCAHVRTRMRSTLIEEGYDREIVEDLPSWQSTVSFADRDVRNRSGSDWHMTDTSPDHSTDLVEVHECYLRLDANGDGVAETMRVVMGGIPGRRSLLACEEWGDDFPFSDIVPSPRPYAWRGVGLYDEIADVQRVKTTCLRAMLDNIYLILHPQKQVVGNAVENMDELLNPTFGGVIFVKAPNVIAPLETPTLVDKVAPIIEYMDSMAQRRTGVWDQSQALDMDALQNQSATAVNAMQSIAYSRIEELARNVAEIGMRRVFKCILKLVVKHQDKARTLKLRGEWTPIDPRAWDVDMEVSVNTGLGTGSRQADLATLANVAAKQELIIAQAGPSNPLAGVDKYAHTLRKMVETAGVKSPDEYFSEISPEQMQALQQQMGAAKPDPKMMAAQAAAALAQQKTQADIAMAQQKMQADIALAQQKAQADAAHEVMRSQTDTRLEQAKLERQAQVEDRQLVSDVASKQKALEADVALEQQRARFDAALEQQKFEFERQLQLQKFAFEQQMRGAP